MVAPAPLLKEAPPAQIHPPMAKARVALHPAASLVLASEAALGLRLVRSKVNPEVHSMVSQATPSTASQAILNMANPEIPNKANPAVPNKVSQAVRNTVSPAARNMGSLVTRNTANRDRPVAKLARGDLAGRIRVRRAPAGTMEALPGSIHHPPNHSGRRQVAQTTQTSRLRDSQRTASPVLTMNPVAPSLVAPILARQALHQHTQDHTTQDPIIRARRHSLARLARIRTAGHPATAGQGRPLKAAGQALSQV
jgi:hypothetical protein